mmetsp:Transcript_19884/g.66198  ORF Transcript_19884/g.66198 Transcript_19884/m.66198 type:complete len:102 (+) Transcript_19884:1317-1622(+)
MELVNGRKADPSSEQCEFLVQELVKLQQNPDQVEGRETWCGVGIGISSIWPYTITRSSQSTTSPLRRLLSRNSAYSSRDQRAAWFSSQCSRRGGGTRQATR